MISVAVAGASGYAGGEVLRLLSGHPQVRLGALTAHSNAGQQLGSIQPHLRSLAGVELLDTTAENLSGHDVVFLALPHGASGPLAAQLGDRATVIDIAADHRLADEATWTEFYGDGYAGCWPYGLPELPLAGGGRQRDNLRGVNRIAVPGCYPTSIALALAPGFAAGVLDGGDVVVVAASGTSGAGKALKAHLLGSEVMGSMSPYGVGGVHRHIPEAEQSLRAAGGEPVTVSFTPTLAPMARGILSTCTARLKDPSEAAELYDIWRECYAGERFVHLLPEGQWPRTADVIGSNSVHLQVTYDARAGRVIVAAAEDNLAKGTAGAAVQCMNLALGLDEGLGLSVDGVAP